MTSAVVGYLADELKDDREKSLHRRIERVKRSGPGLDFIRPESRPYGVELAVGRRPEDHADRPAHVSAGEWARVLRDRAVFERRKEELCHQYQGNWIAILGEEVVDSDSDRASLVARVAEVYPGVSVFIGGCGVRRPVVPPISSVGSGFFRR